jgi:hypothetical protein
MDPKSLTAIFSRCQKARLFHDNVIAFQDYARGDGKIFAGYRRSPVESTRMVTVTGGWRFLEPLMH